MVFWFWFVIFYLLKGFSLIETYPGCRNSACSVSLLKKSGWVTSTPRLLRDVSGFADQAEWISSCQCDLIKKAPFHISVCIRLCNCYCFSPTLSPGTHVCDFFLSVYYCKCNLTLLSRVVGSIPRSPQLISPCVKRNDSTTVLQYSIIDLAHSEDCH